MSTRVGEDICMKWATASSNAPAAAGDPVAEATAKAETDIRRLTKSARRSRQIGTVTKWVTFVIGPSAIVAAWIFKPPLTFRDDFFSATAQVAAALLIGAIVEGGLTHARSTRMKIELDAETERTSDRLFHAERALDAFGRKVEKAHARLDDAKCNDRGQKTLRALTEKLTLRENEEAACGARVIRLEQRQTRLRVESAERNRQRSSVYSLVGLNMVWFLLAEGASLFALLNDGDSFLAVTATISIWLSAATLAEFVASRLDDLTSALDTNETR